MARGIASRPSIEQWTVAFFTSALVAAIVVPVATHAATWLGLLTLVACFSPFPWIARRIPNSLRGALRRRPVVAVAWLLVASLGVLQMGRLSAFMADSSRLWGSTVPDPAASKHQCLSAYVHAADLVRRGEKNIYDPYWYPGFTAAADSYPGFPSPVEGLGPWISDPYEYPPPFLLLPRAALAITNSFDAIRSSWFVLQSLVLLLAGLLLASWVGARHGLFAALLLPLLFGSIPTMLDLQFGQFHMMAVVLAVTAMIAFSEQRVALGGALLAFALLSKVFPGVLLLYLALRREWRAVAWTGAFVVGFTLLSIPVLDWEPFVAFFTFQLPRLVSGKAFLLMSGKVPAFFIARNFSVSGIVAKLGLLGVPGMGPAVARVVRWLYLPCIIALNQRVARRSRDRLGEARTWLALLSLASLASPLAPSAYVTVPSLWLLTYLAGEIRGRVAAAILFGLVWALIVGTPPLPGRADILVALIGQLLVLAVNVWVLLRPGPAQVDEAEPMPSRAKPMTLQPES